MHGSPDLDTVERMHDGDMPLDSDIATTMIATYLVQYILYRVDDMVENDPSASEDRRLQFTAMLPAMRWADEQSLGIALAAAVERATRQQRWIKERDDPDRP